VEFLASQAPLTGSDALHYHFTAQKQILEFGFHPFFSDSNSFLCGQHHVLILFGLALGSERLALGFIYLGGILTTASLACLASRWASEKLVLASSLLFLLSPVVFWQITSSGAPDIFMAFLACTANDGPGSRRPDTNPAASAAGGFLSRWHRWCKIYGLPDCDSRGGHSCHRISIGRAIVTFHPWVTFLWNLDLFEELCVDRESCLPFPFGKIVSESGQRLRRDKPCQCHECAFQA
jgi:hypothetical protein